MMTFGLGHLRISASISTSISAPRGAKKSRLPEKGPLLETPGRVRLGRSAELLQNCRLVMRTWSATLLCSTCTVIFCMLGNRVAVQPTVVGFDGIKDPMRLLLSARVSGRSEVKRVRSERGQRDARARLVGVDIRGSRLSALSSLSFSSRAAAGARAL